MKIGKLEKTIKREQQKSKLAALAEKKKQGKLTLEDVDAKLDIILEMLADLDRR